MSSESQASKHAPQQDDSAQAQDQASQRGQDGRSGNDYRDNVDAAEVAKFEALASRWWDKESEFKPLHEINPLRLDFIDARAGLVPYKATRSAMSGSPAAPAWRLRNSSISIIRPCSMRLVSTSEPCALFEPECA